MPSSPTISIIIPVFNEQKNIAACINNIRETCGKESELIVVDGSQDGTTLSIIDDRKIIRLQTDPGRALQMNKGAAIASGDILIFLHADTRLPHGAARLVREALDAPAATAGAFKLSFDNDSPVMSTIAFIADLRSRIERVPYGDQAIFIKKETFLRLGGFPEIPIMEDVEFFRNIKKIRHEIIILKASVITSSRRYLKSGPLRCSIRNIILRLLHLCGVSPATLVKMYRKQAG